MHILPNSRKLTLDTSSITLRSKARRSHHCIYASAIEHHSGKRVLDIIPCTCSDSHIIAQPGTPCLVDVLSPPSDSLLRHYEMKGLHTSFSQLNDSTSSISFVSANETAEAASEPPKFQYDVLYSPDGSSEHNTDVSCVASEMRDANGKSEKEEMLFYNFNLPLVKDSDFNYYPERISREHGHDFPAAAPSDGRMVVHNDSKTKPWAKSATGAKKKGLRNRWVTKLGIRLATKA